LIKPKHLQIDDAGIQFCSNLRRNESSFNDSFTKRYQLWNAIGKLKWNSENFAKPRGYETTTTGNVPVFTERNFAAVGFVVSQGMNIRLRNKNAGSNLKMNSGYVASDTSSVTAH